jgi:hypothetical protein
LAGTWPAMVVEHASCTSKPNSCWLMLDIASYRRM